MATLVQQKMSNIYKQVLDLKTEIDKLREVTDESCDFNDSRYLDDMENEILRLKYHTFRHAEENSVKLDFP